MLAVCCANSSTAGPLKFTKLCDLNKVFIVGCGAKLCDLNKGFIVWSIFRSYFLVPTFFHQALFSILNGIIFTPEGHTEVYNHIETFRRLTLCLTQQGLKDLGPSVFDLMAAPFFNVSVAPKILISLIWKKHMMLGTVPFIFKRENYNSKLHS